MFHWPGSRIKFCPTFKPIKINPMYYVLCIEFKTIIWALSSRQLSGHNDKGNNMVSMI